MKENCIYYDNISVLLDNNGRTAQDKRSILNLLEILTCNLQGDIEQIETNKRKLTQEIAEQKTRKRTSKFVTYIEKRIIPKHMEQDEVKRALRKIDKRWIISSY